MWNAKHFEGAKSISTWATALGVCLLWFLLLKELAVDWNLDPQYGYGWGVPPLLLYLFWKRWPDRPVADVRPASRLFWVGSALLAFGVLPLRLVQEANPDWRLVSWLMTLTVVALSFCGLHHCGGRSWIKHFAPVIFFILLSVPWPGGIEKEVTHSLMRAVTAVTVEAMNWLGQGAAAQGNVIVLTNGGVGVTEACSGIRSFQTSCMLAILFGELYRLSVARRLGVLLLGISAAVVLNTIRAFALTWLCAQKGPELESAWHDQVGLVMLGTTVAAVWAIARAAARGSTISSKTEPELGTADLRMLPLPVASIVVLWLLFAEGAVQGWYRWHERRATGPAASWSVKWPSATSGFKQKELPAETRKLLRCDQSESGRWLRADGAEWTLFFLRWHPGRMAAQLAKGHTPDVCLPANGFKQMSALGRTTVHAHGLEIPFNTYVFSANGQLHHVFFCQVDDHRSSETDQPGNEASAYLAALEPAQRLRSVRQGRRHAGHQVLEIAMTGYPDQEAAEEALHRELPLLIAPVRAEFSARQ